jgi:polysaccharide biosynthesis transport protein
MDGLYEQFRIALHQVWQSRWLAMGVAMGVCLHGWLVLALIPNSYESRARVLVQTQGLLPTQMGITPADRQADMLRVKQSLTSNENLERVVRRTELNNRVRTDRDLAAEIGALRQSNQIIAQPDNMVEIVATSGVAGFSNAQNARNAAGIVQSLVDLFVEENLAGNRRETGQSIAFLDEEIRQREARLQEAEQRRVEFDQRFTGLLPGSGTIADRMAAAQAELSNLEQQIVAAQSALGAMRNQLSATPASLPMAGAAGGASGQLAALEAQLAQAVGRGWTDQHPDIIALRDQIARIRPQAEAEQRSGAGGLPNPAYVSLRAMMAEREAQLAGAQARRNQIRADLQLLSSRQATEPGLAAEQTRINRDYEVLKQQYDRLLGDREQLRLRSDAQTQTDAFSLRVIEPASFPTAPSAPNRPILLTLVLVVASGAGIAAAFVLGQVQTTFATQNGLAAASGLPVLGTVRELVLPPERARRRRKLAVLGAAGMALAGGYGILMAVEFWQRSTVA